MSLQLAETGEISLSGSKLKKHIGRLLAARYDVHLLSDILDTPNVFWENPELQARPRTVALYHMIACTSVCVRLRLCGFLPAQRELGRFDK